MWEFEQHTGTTQIKALNLLLEANAGPQAKQKRVGHFPRKMDLIMHFREKLKKSAPHFPQKNNRKQNKKQHKQKQNKNTTRKTQKKQQQTKQAENCESVYWHTQVRVFCLGFC